MRFEYQKNESIPSLSWLAEISKRGRVINITHGTTVECYENFFVSGVWDGEFEKGEFDTALSFHGTGGIALEDSDFVTFVTPNHLQESLYSLVQNDEFLISNSLPFLLAYSGHQLDTNYYGYEYDLNSIFFGSKRCVKELKLKNAIVQMHRYCNLKVSCNLLWEEIPKSAKVELRTFNDYKLKMSETLHKIISNASDAKRKCQYNLVTTVSKGYDASASSALVHDLGCNTALTFSSPEKYVNDSGVEIAQLLGYKNIIEGDGCAYMNNTALWEAESASCGDVGCLVAFNTFEQVYKDSLLFLGLKGDSIWGKDESLANRNFDFIKMSIAAEQNPEHYLRNNTIAISVPLILGYEWPSIYEINNSSEMEKYSVGGEYDRPIPRRFVEEKGVPRKAFGFKKHGAGFTYRFQPTLKSVKSKMSLTSYNSLLDYSKSIKRNRLKYYTYVCKYYMKNFPTYFNYVMHRLHSPFKIKCTSKYMSSPIASLLILWGMNEMIKRYKKAI